MVMVGWVKISKCYLLMICCKELVAEFINTSRLKSNHCKSSMSNFDQICIVFSIGTTVQGVTWNESLRLRLQLWKFGSDNIEVTLVCKDGNFFATVSGDNWWLHTTWFLEICEEQESLILAWVMGRGDRGEGGEWGEKTIDAAGERLHWLLPCCYLVLPHQASAQKFTRLSWCPRV